MVQRIESLLPYAAEKGVMLALENHGGGVTVTAEQLLRLVRAVNGPNFGVNLDTGNFHGQDPYAEIARPRPTRSTCRSRPRSAGRAGRRSRPTWRRIIGILREARYSGYVVLEYDAAEDPMTAVPRYVKTLRVLDRVDWGTRSIPAPSGMEHSQPQE